MSREEGGKAYPFEWAIGMLKHGLAVRRRSWPPNQYVSSLRAVDLVTHVPRLPPNWGILAQPGQYPEIVKVDTKRLVGFVLVVPESEELTPYTPSQQDLLAEDWDQAYRP